MSYLFISDLHLEESRPDVTNTFFNLLEKNEGNIEHLYILGDFFELWIGDDFCSELTDAVIGRLKTFSKKTPISLMRGNRDFLIGEEFCRKSGCTLIPKPIVLDLYDKPTLILHGDTLCTDDIEYQKFRRVVHDKQWQSDFLKNNIEHRMAIANQLRAQSKASQQHKTDEIMDVNLNAVESLAKKYHVNQIIHGHTHRPNIHNESTGSIKVKRIVLGDWYKKGWALEVNKQETSLIELPLIPHR